MRRDSFRRKFAARKSPGLAGGGADAGVAATPWLRREVIGDCTLYLADCLQVLPTLGCVDALVTDPPYGINEAAGKSATRRKNGVYRRDYGDKNWDSQTCDDAVHAAIRLARWSIVFGGNYYRLPPSSCWLVWDKLNGSTHFADCELAWTNLPIAVKKISLLWNGLARGGGESPS